MPDAFLATVKQWMSSRQESSCHVCCDKLLFSSEFHDVLRKKSSLLEEMIPWLLFFLTMSKGHTCVFHIYGDHQFIGHLGKVNISSLGILILF